MIKISYVNTLLLALILGMTTIAPAITSAASARQKTKNTRVSTVRPESTSSTDVSRGRAKKTTAPTLSEPTAVTAPISAPQPTPVVTVSAPLGTAANTRSLWVWGAAEKIVTDAQAQDDFFAFAQAPHGDASLRLNRVYFYSDSLSFGSGAPALRAFLKRAHGAGIAVEYLTGSSKWALTGQGGSATSRVDKMITFNAGSEASERFDGMHFDIEPYLLAEWKTDRATLAQNYMDILHISRAKIVASGQKLLLNVDIPTWYSAKVPEIWEPLTAYNTPVSGATIMNYFDEDSTFLYGYGGKNTSGGIGPNLAKSNNLVLTFGAETMPIDPVSITFFEEGAASLSSVFAAAQEMFGADAQFGGLAVHHYETFRTLK